MSEIEPQKILESLAYVLQHVDGLHWACDVLESPPESQVVTLTIGDRCVRHSGFRPVTNALVEAGIMACRRSINFLGIRVHPTTGRLDVVGSRWPDDAGIEQLSLAKVTLDEFLLAPPGPREETQRACEQILRAADKGVAHLTVDRGERAFSDDLRVCASATVWAVETFVYNRLGVNVPDYRRWTGGLTTA
jgi:hypothetical protein